MGVSVRGATRQEGVVDYLIKPFERERVLAAVGRAVEWRQAVLAKAPRRTAAGDPFGGPTSGGVG